jgi:hypothetical protein
MHAIGWSSLILVFVLISLATIMGHGHFNRPWPSVTGHVLETRVAVEGTRDGGQFGPGVILYRVEAHVTYQINGQQFDRWLPASETDHDKAYLELWLAQKKNKLCIVHWNPDNPLDIEVVLS